MINRLECRAVAQMIWDYAAQRLGESDIERIERHLPVCDKCRLDLEGYLRTISLVRSHRVLELPESKATWNELRSTLEFERQNARRSERRGRIPALSLAGATVLVLLVAAGVRMLLPRFDGHNRIGPFKVTESGISTDASIAKITGSKAAKSTGADNENVILPTPNLEPSLRRTQGQVADAGPSSSGSKNAVAAPQLARDIPGVRADSPIDLRPKQDFVMTPVKVGAGSEGRQFVMGSIPGPDSGITTASYTVSEDAPVW